MTQYNQHPSLPILSYPSLYASVRALYPDLPPCRTPQDPEVFRSAYCQSGPCLRGEGEGMSEGESVGEGVGEGESVGEQVRVWVWVRVRV